MICARVVLAMLSSMVVGYHVRGTVAREAALFVPPQGETTHASRSTAIPDQARSIRSLLPPGDQAPPGWARWDAPDRFETREGRPCRSALSRPQ